MNLLFCINQKYIQPFLVCARSIAAHGGEQGYTAYILHSDLDQSSCEAIDRQLPEPFQCHYIRVEETLFQGFPESKRYPQQIYYRLAAPFLLPESLDRILYLDVDLVVINSLHPLYHTEFNDNYIVACTHADRLLTKANQLRLGTEKNTPYINTGVMLYNLTAMRENLSLQELRAYTMANAKRLILPDQDILTALYGDKVKLEDERKYNFCDRLMLMNNLNPCKEKLDMDWVRKNTAIVHYIGRHKPWDARLMRPMDVFYHEFETEQRCC